jgi:HK97 family phage major capsid protein
MTLAEMKQLRARRRAEARKIAGNAQTRDLTPDEEKQITDLADEVEKLTRRVEALESAEEDETEPEPDAEPEPRSAPAPKPKAPELTTGRKRSASGQRHRYSIMKVVRHLAGMGKLDGIEAEVHNELRDRRDNVTKGVLVPHRFSAQYRDAGDLLDERRAIEALMRMTPREFRDVTTSTAAGGIAAILGTDFIDILRAKMVTQQLGARVLSEMTGGTFSLPKKTAKGTTYWVTEGTAPTNSNLTIGQVTFTPKTVGAVTDLSRKFMLQTSLDADNIVKDDLVLDMSHEIDRVGISGSGSGAEPLGITNDSSVGIIAVGTNGGDPTWDIMVNLETTVTNANADGAKMAYVTSPNLRGKLKRVLIGSNTAAKFIWDNQTNTVNGYNAVSTNQVPSNLTKGTSSGTCTAAIFGNWESLHYALWGGFDLIEDPYTKSNVGGLRLVALQDLDVQHRYEESFAVCKDFTYA